MSIDREQFAASANEFTARLEIAQEEIIVFMRSEAVALVKELVGFHQATADHPERTRANLGDLIDAYPGGALGLAGAGLAVMKALAAKRREAKAARKGGLSVVEAADLDAATAELEESMRRHPSSTRPL